MYKIDFMEDNFIKLENWNIKPIYLLNIIKQIFSVFLLTQIIYYQMRIK